MTMTDSLDGLIERVERCTGPDREIDGLIACEFRIHPFGPFHWFNRSLDVRLVSYGGDVWMSDDTNGKFPGSSFQASAYTAIIDSALALVERKLPGWSWCGTMFGLGTEGHELRRHRLFESNISILAPDCQHSDGPVVGVYGGHARRRSAKHGGRGTRDIWANGHRAAMAEAMGMDWATCDEMSEAIPPAYAEFIGRAAIAHIESQRIAA